MGNYIGIYEDSGDPKRSLGGDRIGGAGSASFLVSQWIAGYALAPKGTNVHEAAKARKWLQYFGEKLKGEHLDLSTIRDLTRALQDQTEDSSWVGVRNGYGHADALDRVVAIEVQCLALRSLVFLYRCTTTGYEMSPEVTITNDLMRGIKLGTAALVKIDAAWAQKCVQMCAIVEKGHAAHGRLQLG